MVSTELLIIREDRLVQLLNADSPMLVTEGGMVIVLSRVQEWNAWGPMLWRLSDSLISVAYAHQ